MNLRKSLLTNLVLACAITLAGCDQKPRAHHVRHVHKDTPLVVYYIPSSGDYYGHDTSTDSWYRYNYNNVDPNRPTTWVNESAKTASAPSGQTFFPSSAPVRGSDITQVSAASPNTAAEAVGSSVERGGFGSIGTAANQETTRSFGLPPGGGWSKADAKPAVEEAEQLPETAEVVTDAGGRVQTETEVEAENAQDTAAEASESMSSESTSSESSSSDSSSSSADSGSSGGDGGGGGGDGGGGGGD